MAINKFASTLTLSLVSVFSLAGILSADPLHVSEAEAERSIVRKTRPEFPAIARQLKLSGKVVVDLTVGEDGSVEDASIVTGNPVLAAAAQRAGKNWKFQPFRADGKPSKAVVRVSFDFTE
jgi:protein TonB